MGIILDTYLDRQNGFVFATTPVGIEYDGQVIKEGEGGGITQSGQTRAQSGSMGGFNLNWDGSWTVATSVDSLGWYAEFRIPFSTLRYGGGATQSWGLNVVRAIRRKNEEAFWSFVPRQFNLMRLSRAGTLEGIRVPARRVATVTPYVLGGVQRNYVTESEARNLSELGIDAKYGLTPSVTLDLTYNTTSRRWGRRAANQPHALSAFLPGKTAVLPRERRDLFRRHAAGGRAVLQPPHRNRYPRQSRPDCRRWSRDRSGRGSHHRRDADLHRPRRGRAARYLLLGRPCHERALQATSVASSAYSDGTRESSDRNQTTPTEHRMGEAWTTTVGRKKTRRPAQRQRPGYRVRGN